MTPRYGPAVLRALAAWDHARYSTDASDFRAAQRELWDALDAHRAETEAAVPVLPDESERDVSPHRFKAARGMEPL